MRKKNKNKKINNIVIKSFIVIAVVIMLISVMPSEASQINEKNKTCLDKEVVSEDNAIAECYESSDLTEQTNFEDVKEVALAEKVEKSSDLLDANANRDISNPYHQVQNIKSSPETKSAKSPGSGTVVNDTQANFTTGTLTNLTATADDFLNLSEETYYSENWNFDASTTWPNEWCTWFIDGAPGGGDRDWTIDATVNYTAPNSMRLRDADAKDSIGAGRSSGAIKTTGTAEFVTRISSTAVTKKQIVGWLSGSTTYEPINVRYYAGNIEYNDGATFYTIVSGYTADRWYKFKITFNITSYTYDLEVRNTQNTVDESDDTVYSATGKSMATTSPATTRISYIEFWCPTVANTYTFYADNVKLYSTKYKTSGNIISATTSTGSGTNITNVTVSWNASKDYTSTTTATVGTGTTTDYIPINSDIGREQDLYLASDIGTAGIIDKIAINKADTASATYYNFRFYLSHTSKTTLTTSYSSNYDNNTRRLVFGPQDVTFPASTGWFEFDLNNEFIYDGTSNLIVEMMHDGRSAATAILTYTTAVADMDAYSSNLYSDSASLYGERPNMRFDIIPNIHVYASNNNGDNWAEVQNNTLYQFTTTGYQLKYKFEFIGGSDTAKLDNITLNYNYETTANTPPNPPANLGVQTYTSSPDILNITDHTPDLNYTYTDPEGDSQFQRNFSVYDSSWNLLWYDNATESVASGSNVVFTDAAPALSDGNDYYFNVTCNDTGSNNWCDVVSVKFHMNTVPTTSGIYVEGFASGTSDILNITDHYPFFNWTYSDSENSAETQFNISVWAGSGRTDTLMWFKNATDANITATYGEAGGGMSPLTLADGIDYYVSVQTKDGYEWSSWIEVKFHMNEEPTTSGLYVENFASGTSNILNITDHYPFFNWTYSDPEGSSLSAFNVSVWNGSVGSGALMWYKNATDSNLSATYGEAGGGMTPLSLADGYNYNVSVKTKDGYEWGSWCETMFHMNTPPPAPTIPVTPSNGETGVSTSTAISWTNLSDSEGSQITYYWYVDVDNPPAFPYNASGSTTTNTSVPLSLDPDITYYWRVMANDSYENATEWSQTWSFTTESGDTTPPDSSVDALPWYWNITGTATITATATDATGVQSVGLWYSYSSDNVSWGAMTFKGLMIFDSGNTWKYTTFTFTAEGWYNLSTNSTDSSSNHNEETVNYTGDQKCGYDTTAPSVNAGSDATKNEQFLQDATVSDPSPSSGIATHSWTKDSGPGTIAFGT
ncbi:MAG: hypothetical protein L6265_07290, partial [Thermoplasmatales archaeon]|nr:hypothetical protein [Thermoplasmatales archaeon]